MRQLRKLESAEPQGCQVRSHGSDASRAFHWSNFRLCERTSPPVFPTFADFLRLSACLHARVRVRERAQAVRDLITPVLQVNRLVCATAPLWRSRFAAHGLLDSSSRARRTFARLSNCAPRLAAAPLGLRGRSSERASARDRRAYRDADRSGIFRDERALGNAMRSQSIGIGRREG